MKGNLRIGSELPPQKPVPQRLLSVEQAAEYLGLSKWEVYKMIEDGTPPCVRRGKRKLVDKKDLDDWIDKNKEGGE